MKEKTKIIIFTDLDGTLLDKSTYSYQKALLVLNLLRKRGIPIIFCTTKTKAENEYYQRKLKIKDPFIVENGGAIFIPKDYFSLEILKKAFPQLKIYSNYFIIELGVAYPKLRRALKEIKAETKFKIIGFGDLTIKEVARDANLPFRLAKLAKMKKYNESFKFLEPPEKEKILFRKAREKGFKILPGGRYYNIFGKNTDKGKAVKILTKLFKMKFKKIKTIGLGDSLTDLPLLKEVNLPILVQKPPGIWEPKLKLKGLIKVKGIGPQGWARAIRKFVLN